MMPGYALIILWILGTFAAASLGLGLFNWWADRRHERRQRLKFHPRMRG